MADTPLARQIKAQIDATGGISIAEFMRRALTDPTHGYYMQSAPIGRGGDFITAPEISQIFGELIGIWAGDYWQRAGAPAKVHLVELGGGRGTLMQDALRAASVLPDFRAALRVHFVECSPHFTSEQRARVPQAQSHQSIDTLPDGPLLLIANEFFDALPIQQFIDTANGAVEVRIDHRDGALFFTPDVEKTTEPIYEVCAAGETIVTQLAQRLAAHGGAALIIDYGYGAGARGDTLQAVRGHEFCHPLADIGLADVTAHVNFARLAIAAQDGGAYAFPLTTQAAFLDAMGGAMRAEALTRAQPDKAGEIRTAYARLTAPDQMGRLFKVLCFAAAPDPQPAGFARAA